MCSKVNVENEGAAAAQCYTQFQNGREIEVCVCESRAGMQPCNTAAALPLDNRLLLALLVGVLAAFFAPADPVPPLIGRSIGV